MGMWAHLANKPLSQVKEQPLFSNNFIVSTESLTLPLRFGLGHLHKEVMLWQVYSSLLPLTALEVWGVYWPVQGAGTARAALYELCLAWVVIASGTYRRNSTTRTNHNCFSRVFSRIHTNHQLSQILQKLYTQLSVIEPESVLHFEKTQTVQMIIAFSVQTLFLRYKWHMLLDHIKDRWSSPISIMKDSICTFPNPHESIWSLSLFSLISNSH